MKSNAYRNCIANGAVFFLVLFSTLWMMSGIEIGSSGSVLSASHLRMFQFFTVDSNVLMGIIALIAALAWRKAGKEGKTEVSRGIYILVLVGTAAVTLTMLVTVFFLAPTFGENWLMLFAQSNFFLHLVTPLCSILILVFLEKNTVVTFWDTLFGMIPMLLYAVYYMGNALSHAQGDVIPRQYDWYGFLMFGKKTMIPVILIVCLVQWLICFALWKFSRKKN